MEKQAIINYIDKDKAWRALLPRSQWGRFSTICEAFYSVYPGKTNILTLQSINVAIAKSVAYGLLIGDVAGEAFIVKKGNIAYYEDNKQLTCDKYILMIGRDGYVKKAKEQGTLLDYRILPIEASFWNNIEIEHGTEQGDKIHGLKTKLVNLVYDSHGDVQGLGGFIAEMVVPGLGNIPRMVRYHSMSTEQIQKAIDFSGVLKNVEPGMPWDKWRYKMKQALVTRDALKSQFRGTSFMAAIRAEEEEERRTNIEIVRQNTNAKLATMAKPEENNGQN